MPGVTAAHGTPEAAPDQAAVDAGMQGDVDRWLLILTYRRLRMSILMSVGVIALFAGILWPLFPAPLMWSWLALLLLTAATRYAVWMVYERSTAAARDRPIWNGWFIFSSIIGGASWGIGAMLLMPQAGDIRSLMLIVTLLSVSAVSVSTTATHLAALCGFLASALLPVAAALFLTGGEVERITALALCAGLVSLVMVGRATGRNIRALVETKLRLAPALRSAQENLMLVDALFETIPLPVVLKDTRGRFVRLNPAYAELMGDSVASMIGMDAHGVVDAQVATIHAAVDRELIAQPGRRTYEVRQRLRGGREFDALISKASLVGADGAVTGLVVTVVDISTQKASAQALLAAKEAAESASRAKTRFLANMSHELRSPLNAVIGAAQLLRSGGQSQAEEEHLVQAIQQSGNNLLGLIENILDLSRIEAGELALCAEDFNLLDCVEAAVATAAVNARAKGISIACIVDPALALWRHGDALRLRQVLLNLLGNAVKFTERGEVALRVAPGAGSADLCISVRDTGIGIGEASLARVFEPFRQADDAANRRFGGSGLGLAIVRQLVEAMGGRITVHSQLGQGSVFDIALALAPAHGAAPAPAPLAHAVAYYEPHESSAEALQALLMRLGCAAQRCKSSAELRAWMALHQGDAGESWLLAAADAPGTWDLVEQSSAMLDPERVIGMTDAESYAADAARERFGLPRNIIKPVLRSALVSRLGALARAAGPAPARQDTAAAPSDKAERRHVLVVEDDALNQTIVCGMLAHAGYATRIAGDGASALEALRREPFDLVLMDWQMPDMDGLEVTRRLRAGEAGSGGREVPIVALTANAFAEDRSACLGAGMNDFLTKPVLAANLIATVGRWIGARQAATLTLDDRQSAQPAAAAPFDPAVLAELPMVADGSQPDYADRVLAMFEKNTCAALDAIEAAARAGDTKTLARAIQSLKSSSGQVGALGLADEAGRLETMLRSGAATAPEWPALLRAQYARFGLALARHRALAVDTAEVQT